MSTAFQALRSAVREAPVRVRVAGTCMQPVLNSGADVPVGAARLHWPGDVLVFVRADGRLVAHRVIGLRPGRELRYFVQADASAEPDSAVPASAVLGRAHVAVSWADRLRALARFAVLLASRMRGRLR
jgi:hypothetical protein